MIVARLEANSLSTLTLKADDDAPRLFTAALNSVKTSAAPRSVGLTEVPGPNDRDFWDKVIEGIRAHEAGERSVTRGPNGVVVSTYGGNDEVKVEQLPDGRLKITVKGAWLPIYVDPSEGPVTIDAGSGNDIVIVSANVGRGVTLKGGSGNDYLEGGSGADVILGGDGYDVIYGLDGNDLIYAGGGNDYVDAGAGNDRAYGGAGNDIVSAGRGDDWISGDAGNDVLIAAAGQDIVDDSGGRDKDLVYAKAGDDVRLNGGSSSVLVQPGDHLGTSIRIEGDESFKKRMESDLDTLRYIPVGQQALASIDASGRTVTIMPSEAIPNNLDWTPQWKAVVPYNGWAKADGTNGDGADVVIGAVPTDRADYDPTGDAQDWRASPPIFALFHEIAHAEDGVYGRVLPKTATSREYGQDIPDSELSATGLPFQQYGDEVPDPNNRVVTENALRRELGWVERPAYSDPANWATEGFGSAPNERRPTGPVRAV